MLSKEAQAYINNKGINSGRVVLHSDLNNFFASVECLKNKSLKKYPVAVCGSKSERHGIVLAKNNIAKSYGIKTGQVIWQAKSLCPDLIVIEPNYEEYLYYSNAVRSIYSEFSDRVEHFGMDESWIELTGTKNVNTLYDGVYKANKLRKSIYEKTGLTVSVGVSDNKIFSKLASDYKKPDAITLFGPNEYMSIISKLPIEEMLYVGRSTKKRLSSFNIHTIGDVARKDVSFFKSIIGKSGVNLYLNACGYDSSDVIETNAPDIIKSIGNSATPPRDLCGREDVKLMLCALCDKVGERLRRVKLRTTVVQIHVRDANLNTYERQGGIFPTDNEILLARKALQLYEENFDESTPIRSIGVRTTGLIDNFKVYQSSFDQISISEEQRQHRIDKAVDDLRLKFGKNIIKRGILCSDKSLCSSLYLDKHIIQPFKSH